MLNFENFHPVVDFVPVDLVVNSALASAWYVGAGQTGVFLGGGEGGGGPGVSNAGGRGEEMFGDKLGVETGGGEGGVGRGGEGGEGGEGGALIVHVATSSENPVKWGLLWDAMPPYYRRHPVAPSKRVGPVFFRWARSPLAYHLLRFMSQTVPAAVADAVAALGVGRGGNLVNSRRLTLALSPLSFFTTNEWCFGTANLARLHASLPPADRSQYNCDVRSICWDIYMTTWAHGMKVFLLKEAPVLSVFPRSRCPQELSRL
jgi:hypothetical protein